MEFNLGTFDAVRHSRFANVGSPFIFVRAGRRKSAAPLNFTLGAMRNMPIFSVFRVVVFAVGFVACSVLVASSFVVEQVLLHVRLSSRAVSFSVSRSSLLCLLFRYASPVFSCGSFSPFYLQRSVAQFASNPALKRDCAKARSPLASRWAYPLYLNVSLDLYCVHAYSHCHY